MVEEFVLGVFDSFEIILDPLLVINNFMGLE
jgi:hypothetical protein